MGHTGGLLQVTQLTGTHMASNAIAVENAAIQNDSLRYVTRLFFARIAHFNAGLM
jgi:hypothetical protein